MNSGVLVDGLGSAMTVAGSVAAHLGRLVEGPVRQAQAGVADVLAGEGGVFLFVLGMIGIAVLVFDVCLLAVGLARRLRRRAAAAPTAVGRAMRARTLASEGAPLVEISRRTGLSQDALLLVVGAESEAAPATAAAERAAAIAPRPRTGNAFRSSAPTIRTWRIGFRRVRQAA